MGRGESLAKNVRDVGAKPREEGVSDLQVEEELITNCIYSSLHTHTTHPKHSFKDVVLEYGDPQIPSVIFQSSYS